MTLLFLGILAALALLLQQRAQKRGLTGVEAQHRLSVRLAEPEERFQLILSLENRSRRFQPFLRWSLRIPEEMEVWDGSAVSDDRLGGKLVSGTTWLRPRQGLEKPISVSISRRGRYLLRELTIGRGDFLGLREERFSCGNLREVVIFPREAPDQPLRQVLGGFLGDVSVRRFLFEDPVLTLGYREYTGREPMKSISWPQSAKAGHLMVKNFDYTADPSLSLVLNVECGQPDAEPWIERCYSLARTVCQELENRGIPYDFYTNAQMLGELSSWRHMAKGLGPRHFRGILEGLGRASCLPACSCGQLLADVARTPSGQDGVIFLTPAREADTEKWTGRLARLFGGQILVLTGEEGIQ